MSKIPTLPAEISSDGREVWDWATKLSERVQLVSEKKRLMERIQRLERVCGSCEKWMLPSCPREVHNNKTGRSSGPSMEAPKCQQFAMSVSDKQRLVQMKAELFDVSRKLK